MNDQDEILPLFDKSEENILRASITTIVSKDFIIKAEWLLKKGWIAIPVESAAHFNGQDAQLLSNAFTAIGYSELIAIALEDMGQEPYCYHFTATVNGIIGFSKKFSYLNFALIPNDVSFLILCTTADYFVIAGHKTFVEMATGKNVEKARSDFVTFAQSPEWDVRDKERLSAVSMIYGAIREKEA